MKPQINGDCPPLREQGHQPFDRDIERTGTYQYTDGSLFSARIANERYTRMILAAADFAGRSVVDVGCGDGTYTAELAERSGAASVLGVDLSLKAVERAQEIYADLSPKVVFACGSSGALIEAKRRFDVAVYRGVIHHVADPRTEIRCALALAKTVIILEPNGLNLLMKIVEKTSPYHRQHHERSFSPHAIGRWVSAGGGHVRSIRFFGLVPYFCPAAMARMGRLFEPVVEALPCVRAICCGQYVVVAVGTNR